VDPHYQDATITLYHGDCLDVLRELDDRSIDAVVTDPPYGLGFMGKAWDDLPPGPEFAAECLRVLKPGGHMLAFGGTRTWHRLVCAAEDAGFEIRDSIAWLYGSGFPKSLDVSKAIDRARTEDHGPVDAIRSWLNARRLEAGLSHDAVNKHFGHASNGGGSSSAWMTNPTSKSLPTWDQWQALKALFRFGDDMDAEVWRLNGRKGKPGDNFEAREILSERVIEVKGGSWAEQVDSGRFKLGEKVIRETIPATPDAQRWQGWGTALKPAFEPIMVARKPLAGTVAGNVLAHGTGALNIDGCRVGDEERYNPAAANKAGGAALNMSAAGMPVADGRVASGRWPANVVLDDTQAAALDQQSGEGVSRVGKPRGADAGDGWGMTATGAEYDDVGGASRFEYDDVGGASRFFYTAKADSSERVRVDGIAHPTVKPLSLMRWLVRLVTPPGGVVLEPFAGSGTTVEACILERFRCVAIEREADYLPLITQRIHRRLDPVQAVKTAAANDEPDLFGLLGDEA